MKISVLTVCFNSEDTISGAIESFLEQKYASREMIVIDGASTDRTVEIIESYKSDEIGVWSEPDRGIYDAMNKALSKFTGDAFGFLNSDDRFHDHTALTEVASALESADLVTGHLNFVRAHDGSAPVRIWNAEPYIAGAFRRGWSLPHPTTYARRSVYQQIGGFDPSFRNAGDFDWLLRALEIEGFRHDIVNRTLVDMMVGGTTTSGMGAMIRNTLELHRARQQRLSVPMLHPSILQNLWRKLLQIRGF